MSLRHARPRCLPFAQRLALAALLLAMALAQSLTFAHRALHHDVRMLAYAHEEHQATQVHGHVDAHVDAHAHGSDCAHGFLGRLFAHHDEGDESCRLLDATSVFFGLKSPPDHIFSAPIAHLLIANHIHAPSAWQAPLFEARAPPVLSL
jgi:hypothetical protein